MSLKAKKQSDMRMADLKDNKFFDPADYLYWQTYTENEKWSKLLAAFLMSWILCLLEGKPTENTIDFWRFKKENMKDKKG